MNYQNYETVIIETHHVKLVGWPPCVLFTSPSNISMKDEILLLCSALKDGDCHWVVLSHEEQLQHAKKLAHARNQGLEIGKKRKERSDKGKPREPRTKQQRKDSSSQIPPMYKSKAIIDDSDESEGEDGSSD